MVKAARSGRLPKDIRRSLLLETAVEIVRREGTEALTLAYLAERCGVTKPIAYQHFGTRAGLLVALYHELGELQARAVASALESCNRPETDLPALARILSTAFVDCVLENGAHYSAISAALVASAEMSDFRRAIREDYIDRYQQALAPLVNVPPPALKLRLTAYLGAAELLMESLSRGQSTREDVIATLSDLLAPMLAH